MPKQKTRKSCAKRVKMTGTGKYKRNHANKRHILTKKSAKRKRRLGHAALIDSSDERRVKASLPNGLS